MVIMTISPFGFILLLASIFARSPQQTLLSLNREVQGNIFNHKFFFTHASSYILVKLNVLDSQRSYAERVEGNHFFQLWTRQSRNLGMSQEIFPEETSVQIKSRKILKIAGKAQQKVKQPLIKFFKLSQKSLLICQSFFLCNAFRINVKVGPSYVIQEFRQNLLEPLSIQLSLSCRCRFAFGSSNHFFLFFLLDKLSFKLARCCLYSLLRRQICEEISLSQNNWNLSFLLVLNNMTFLLFFLPFLTNFNLFFSFRHFFNVFQVLLMNFLSKTIHIDKYLLKILRESLKNFKRNHISVAEQLYVYAKQSIQKKKSSMLVNSTFSFRLSTQLFKTVKRMQLKSHSSRKRQLGKFYPSFISLNQNTSCAWRQEVQRVQWSIGYEKYFLNQLTTQHTFSLAKLSSQSLGFSDRFAQISGFLSANLLQYISAYDSAVMDCNFPSRSLVMNTAQIGTSAGLPKISLLDDFEVLLFYFISSFPIIPIYYLNIVRGWIKMMRYLLFRLQGLI